MESPTHSFSPLATGHPGVQVPGLSPALGHIPVRIVVYWLTLGLALLAVGVPPLRYAIYPTSVLVALTLLADGDFRIGDEAAPLLLFVGAGLVFSPLATTEGLKDVFFTFAGVSLSLLVTAPRVQLRWLFVATLAAAVVYYALPGGLIRGARFDFIHSSSPFESNFGFLFSLLAVFALIDRKKWLSLVCLALAVITLKRIAVGGTVIAALFLWLGERKGRWILNPLVMVVVNLAIVVGLLMYAEGDFDRQILRQTGQSANQFGLGRRAMLALPAREMMHNPRAFVFFGAGPGQTYELATEGVRAFGVKQNLHSDLIKIFYEYGLLAFLAFVALMYRAARYELRVAFLFLNILFVTDNTLIYAFFLCFFVVGARATCDTARR